MAELAGKVKGFLSVEINAGQMIEDVKLSVFDEGISVPVKYYGRMGGIVPTPGEVVDALQRLLIGE